MRNLTQQLGSVELLTVCVLLCDVLCCYAGQIAKPRDQPLFLLPLFAELTEGVVIERTENRTLHLSFVIR